MNKHKHSLVALLVTGIVAVGGFAATANASNGGGGEDHKTSICHRTASDTNPYVFETVDNHSLDAHLNNLPGHPAKTWKSDGTWRGATHVAGDPKNDYLATSELDCQDTTESTEPTEPPTTEPTSPPTTEPTSPPTTEPTEPPTTEPTEPPTTEPTEPPTTPTTPAPPHRPSKPHHPAPPTQVLGGL